MARHRARRADPRRADGRHRYRFQERDRHADPRSRAKSGKAILVLSSELQELLAACDRILVMSDGRMVRDIARHELDDPDQSRFDRRASARREQAQQSHAGSPGRARPMTDSAMPARKTPSPLANWRDYIIYIGFVAIFIIFAATLGQRGFLDPQQPPQHHPPDRHYRGRVRGDDLCARDCGDRSVGRRGGGAGFGGHGDGN